MNDENYKLTVSFVTPENTSEEYSAEFSSLQDALDDADDVAFETVGFPLEDWKFVDFGDANRLYVYYPNEEDMTSRYKLTILGVSE